MGLDWNAPYSKCNFTSLQLQQGKNLCPKDFRKCNLKNSLFVVPKQIKTGKFSLLQRWIPPAAKHHNFVLIMWGCDDVLVDGRVGLWPRKPWFYSRNHQTFFRRTWCLKMCLVSAHSNKDEKKTLPNAMNRFNSAQWRLTIQYHEQKFARKDLFTNTAILSSNVNWQNFGYNCNCLSFQWHTWAH